MDVEAPSLSCELKTEYEELIALLEERGLKQKKELLSKQKEIESLKLFVSHVKMVYTSENS